MLHYDSDKNDARDNEERGFALPYTPKYVFIENEEHARQVIPELMKHKVLAVDTETTGLDPYLCRLLLLQIATPTCCYILNCGKVDASVWKPVIESPNILKIAQNASFDYKILKVHAGASMRPIFDTMIAERLITVGKQRKTSLQYMAAKYLGLDLDKEIRRDFIGVYRDKFSKAELLYAANDALILFEIYDRQIDALQRDELITVALLEFNTVVPVAEMELNGCLLDQGKWRQLLQVARKNREEVEEKIKEALAPVCNQLSIFGECTINISSQKQLLIHLHRLGIDIEDTSDETLKKVKNPVTDLIRKWRGWEKICTAYGEKFLSKINPKTGRLHAQFNQVRADTGRTSSSNPNLQQIPGYDPNEEDSLDFRSCFVAPPGNKIVGADYCLAPETRVLTTDLRWVQLKDISIGDVLVGIDEYNGAERYITGRAAPRQLRKSVVEKKTSLVTPSYRITFSNGTEIISSALHRWLVSLSPKSAYAWVETQNIEVGSRVGFLCDTWEMENTWESGYLAGMFDGEGTISGRRTGRKSGCSLSAHQRPNVCIDAVVEYMKNLDLEMRGPAIRGGGYPGSRGDVRHYWITSIPKMFRFLGSVRPKRLLEKSSIIWEGKTPNLKSDIVVSKIEYIGDTEVIGIQTSTRTFIAEGFVSHNSQQELRILAEMSQDVNFLSAYLNGEDIHTKTACLVYNKTPETVSRKERTNTKVTNFTISYGGSAYTISNRLSISEEEAQEIVDGYFKAFPGVKAYIYKAGNFAVENGYSISVSGRRRYYEVPSLDDPDYKKKIGAIKRKGANMPIQSSAADVSKQALCNFFYEAEKHPEYGINLIIFVHDELICEVKEEYAKEAASLLEQSMISAFSVFFKKIPMKVDAEISNYWRH